MVFPAVFSCSFFFFFFFNDTATTEIYTLSLHDALPTCSPSTRTSAPRSTTAIAGWPRRSPTRSTPHHANHPRTRRSRRSPRGRWPAPGSPRSGSVSSTPTPSSSSGAACNAGSGGASPTPRPISPSLASSPTAPPDADSSQTGQASTPQSLSRTNSLAPQVDQVLQQLVGG